MHTWCFGKCSLARVGTARPWRVASCVTLPGGLCGLPGRRAACGPRGLSTSSLAPSSLLRPAQLSTRSMLTHSARQTHAGPVSPLRAGGTRLGPLHPCWRGGASSPLGPCFLVTVTTAWLLPGPVGGKWTEAEAVTSGHCPRPRGCRALPVTPPSRRRNVPHLISRCTPSQPGSDGQAGP